MKLLKSLISLALIFALIMSITGSALHFHFCSSTGNYYFDVHFPGENSNNHENCFCEFHLNGLVSENNTGLCYEHLSSRCLDIKSESEIDEIFTAGKNLINLNIPEIASVFNREINLQILNSPVIISITPEVIDTSPPEIITTRILLL